MEPAAPDRQVELKNILQTLLIYRKRISRHPGRTEARREWPMAIRDHRNVNIDPRRAPEFAGRGGIVRARGLFGARLPALRDELTDTLVARYLSHDSYQ